MWNRGEMFVLFDVGDTQGVEGETKEAGKHEGGKGKKTKTKKEAGKGKGSVVYQGTR